jgi:excisionase family DNA binding protein
MPDLTTWLTEEETASRLKVSVRTVRRKALSGEIERHNRTVPGRRPEPVFSPDDVDRLTAENPFVAAPSGSSNQLQAAGPQPMHPSLVQAILLFEKLAGPILAQHQETLTKVSGTLDTLVKVLPAGPQTPPGRFTPWLTIKAASEYSGLTVAFLKRQIQCGELYAVRDGRSFKVRKSDLDNLAGVQIESGTLVNSGAFRA